MDSAVGIAIISGLFGIASGALAAYLGAILKFRKELEAEYDKDLRNRRIEVYKALWSDLQFLARYDLPKPLTPQTLEELSVAMRKWYFEVGGLYLSEEARKSYFDLKQAIQDIIENPNYHSEDILDDPQDVLEKASVLRGRLAQDVGTRKSSPIADG